MITIYRWCPEKKCGAWLPPEALAEQAELLRAPVGSVWIDLDDPTPEEEARVFQEFFKVHPLTLDDITKLRTVEHVHFPKAEEFADYLFVIVNPLAPRFLDLATGTADEIVHDGRASTQLSALLTHHLLITHHYEPVTGIKELTTYLGKHDAQAERGPDYLFHIILDSTVDQYAPVLDHFDEDLDEIEDEVLSRPTQELLVRLLALKREIIVLRKTLVHEREVLARLSRGEFTLIADREMVYYRNVYDHLVRFTELIEGSRDLASDLMQTHLASASNRLNEVMKVLTMISTILFPMSLVSGIYGMNFEFMPELHQTWGYPFALGLMVLSGLGSLTFFRWKKWI